MLLKGKVALVTGSGKGLGRAIALTLAREGADVVVVGRSRESLKRAGEEVESCGRNCMVVKADLTVAKDVEELFAGIMKEYSRLDILVNNVGESSIKKPTIEYTEDEWDFMINGNLKTMFLCSREAGKIMLKQGAGAVINVSSVHGLGGIPRRNAYSTAKGAVNNFTKTLACEWAARGVRVNAVAPGYILTETMVDAFDSGAVNREDMLRRTPQGRFGSPGEVAQAVLFLASDNASYVNGAILYVDGGYAAYHGAELFPLI